MVQKSLALSVMETTPSPLGFGSADCRRRWLRSVPEIISSGADVLTQLSKHWSISRQTEFRQVLQGHNSRTPDPLVPELGPCLGALKVSTLKPCEVAVLKAGSGWTNCLSPPVVGEICLGVYIVGMPLSTNACGFRIGLSVYDSILDKALPAEFILYGQRY